jgi:hypothetical protein
MAKRVPMRMRARRAGQPARLRRPDELVAIVQAKMRRPEPSVLSCCAVWKNWESRKIEPEG